MISYATSLKFQYIKLIMRLGTNVSCI